MAGLASGRQLADAGLAVVVLEAARRVGGRVHTVATPERATPWLDVGGRQVGQAYSRLLGLIDRLIGLDDDARRAVAGGVHGAGKREKIRNVVGGLQRVPEAIGRSLGDALRVDAPVVAIDMASSLARVTRLDGTVVLADHVISALSFAALRNVDISPSLEEAQAEAVPRMPYAATTRVWADIRRPFWEEDGFEPSLFSDIDLGMFWVTGSGTAVEPLMGMFLLTAEQGVRIDRLPIADIAVYLVDRLAVLRPSTRGAVHPFITSPWGRHPLIGGARHLYGPGDVTRWAVPMIRPWQRLHFAGEHTRRREYGVEAALESADRVVAEVLAEVLAGG